MRTQEWLLKASQQFEEAGIATGRLDALILLEDEVGKERAWILANPEHILSAATIRRLDDRAGQRVKHTPLAYIRGKVEFYGRTFAVNQNTLIPRPETEAMIDVLGTLNLAAKSEVLDVGTGSGCIAVTAALEFPGLHVTASDVDQNCIDVARDNALRIGADVSFFASNLLDQLGDSYDVILANLPYVPNDHPINPAAKHEPRKAIFGGSDGLAIYRELFRQVADRYRLQYVLTESLPEQHRALAAIAKAAGFSPYRTDDFIQAFRRP